MSELDLTSEQLSQLADGGIIFMSDNIGSTGLLEHRCGLGAILFDKYGDMRAVPELCNINVSVSDLQAQHKMELIKKEIEKSLLIPAFDKCVELLEVEIPPPGSPESFGLTRRNNSECNMRYGIYIENINNCYLAIYRLIVTPLFVTWELIRKVRFSVIQFVKVKSVFCNRPGAFFSGFKTNGLRHWFEGKGKRKRV